MSSAARTRTAIVVLLLVVASACSSKEKPHPSKLIGPLSSYESLKEVQSDLHLKSSEWQVIEDRKPLTSDTRPKFQIYTIAVPYFHRGVQGRLVLHFYNDRLMRTQFYPQDMDGYESALSAQESLSFNDQKESFISPATKVWIGKDEKGGKYVGWVDKNLKAEMDDWIKKYS